MTKLIISLLPPTCLFFVIIFASLSVSGEEDDHQKTQCKLSQWQCHDGTCITLKLRCDGGEPDCLDGSDEDPQMCKNTLNDSSKKCSGAHHQPAQKTPELLDNQQIQVEEGHQEAKEKEEEEEFSLDDFPLVARTDEDDDIIRESLRLIEAGDHHIDEDERYRDVILMAGMSGSGKTTMTKFLSGNNTDLTSYPSSSSGRFSIRDSEGRISSGKSTVVSKSIFPKLILNHQTQTAFFDLPGFGDTRGPSVDLATSVFIKKVADKARRLKIIFVVNYSSLRAGEAKSDFLNLLRHATSFIKNQAKYKPALSLIANKVDVNVPAEDVIPSVAQFLKNVGLILPKIMVDESPEMVQNCDRLIHTLLSSGRIFGRIRGGERRQVFSRLGYLRLPATAGVLSHIPAFQEAKIQLNKMIMENSRYVAKSTNDFGVSLSPQSKLFVRNAVGHLYINMGLLTQELGGEVRNHFMNKFEQASNVYGLINGFRSQLNFLKNKTQTLSTIIEQGSNGDQKVRNFLGGKKRSKRMELLQILQEMAQAVEINDPDRVLSETMGRNLEHLDFLEALLTDENRAETLKIWERVLESWTSPIRSALEDVQNTIYNVGKMVNTVVASSMALTGSELETLYEDQSELIYDAISDSATSSQEIEKKEEEEIRKFLEDMKSDSELLENLIQRLMDTRSIREFYNVTATSLDQLKVVTPVPQNVIDLLTLPPSPSEGEEDVDDDDRDFSLLDLDSKPSPYSPALWVVPLEKLQATLDDTVQTMTATIRSLEQDKVVENFRDTMDSNQALFDYERRKVMAVLLKAGIQQHEEEEEEEGQVEVAVDK